jgi:hypothetical protein
MPQLKLFNTFNASATIGRDVTFYDAKYEEVHRWYPYLEGFAEKFIDDIVKSLDFVPQHIYEPFAGSGTLPVYCLSKNIDVTYSEVNPFLQELIAFKTGVLSLSAQERQGIQAAIIEYIAGFRVVDSLLHQQHYKGSYADVFGKSVYFDDENFIAICSVKQDIDRTTNPWLIKAIKTAGCEALLPSSYLKRNGDIRYKKGKELNTITRFEARFISNLEKISSDLGTINFHSTSQFSGFSNAKELNESLIGQVDLVITSPPYLNGTNYIRNTKMELWFMGYLTVKSDLAHYRKEVVTSGINDVTSTKKYIKNERIESLVAEKGLLYDQRIPKMINDYFFDMSVVFRNMYAYMRPGARAFIDIGDSIYGGVHVATDEILIDILKQEGFDFIDNLELRKRKSKGGETVKQTLIVVSK